MRFNYTDAEVNLLLALLDDKTVELSERMDTLIGNGHSTDSPRYQRLVEQEKAVARLFSKIGNDASGYTVEESEASLENL